MTDKKIQILLDLQSTPPKGVDALTRSLKQAGEQANKTRERMEKLAQVGNRVALLGGAMLAPFALAMKKYVDATGETEETSARIIELQKKWEESQVRIGRVTAEIVLPALETALDVVNKIATFAEKHPDAIKAAVGIGATLVVLGGMLSTAATIVSTIATVQGLAAGLGIGGAAAAGGTAAAGGGVAAVVSAIAPAMIAAAPYIAVALAVVIAAELTRRLVNWAMGTDQTWADIGNTLIDLKDLFVRNWGILSDHLEDWFTKLPDRIGKFITDGVVNTINGIGSYFTSLGNYFTGLTSALWDGFQYIAGAFVSGFEKLLSYLPGRAGGGYVGGGIYRMGENGKEFVMNNNTTRAAEQMLGGQLSQERLMAGMSGSRRITYNDNRRIDSSLSKADRRVIKNDIMDGLAGAFS